MDCYLQIAAPVQWGDVFIPDGSKSSTIQWPLTAKMLNVVAVHGGKTNIAVWPGYKGDIVYTEVEKVNCYVVGLFK